MEKARKKAKKLRRFFKDVEGGLILEVQRALVKKPEILHQLNKKGRSALHIAALSGNFQICLMLIRRGARVDGMDNSGNTPLIFASKQGHWHVAELLLEKGAVATSVNKKGRSASSYGVEEAVARICAEDVPKNIVRDDEAEHESREREWREKLLEEHDFEYLEGRHREPEQEWSKTCWKDWFHDEDTTNEDDWWESMARQMRRRFSAFSTKQPNIHGIHEKSSASSDTSRKYHAQGSGGLAWENKWVREGSAGNNGATSLSHDQRAAAHALAWEQFLLAHGSAAESCAKIRFTDVPWPLAPQNATPALLAEEALLLPSDIGDIAQARKRAVREALRRWHPDKFGQRFGRFLSDDDRERILDRVKMIAQALTSLV